MSKKHFITFLLRHQKIFLIVISFISLLFLFFSFTLKFDSSIDVWFLENDPNLQTYHEFLDRFQADEIVVMGVFADDVFDREVLAAIAQMSKMAEDAPFAYRVRSLTNVKVSKASKDWLEISNLISQLPQNMTETEQLRKRALDNEILKGILSRDSQATAIIVELDPKGNSFEGKIALTESLREIAAKVENAKIKVYLSGSPSIDEAFYVYSKSDLQYLVPIVALMILIIMFLFLRRFSVVIIPFAVVTLSGIWVLGLMGLLGLKINIMTSGVLAVVLAVGVADAIHLVTDYLQQLFRAKENPILEAMTSLIKPCFLTTITTVAGLMALLVSDLKPVREFGYLAAIGVCFAFVLTFTLVPAFLLRLQKPEEAYLNQLKSGLLSRLLIKLGQPRMRTSQILMIIMLLLVGLSGFAVSKLEVGANVFNYFREHDPVRVETVKVEDKIGGSAAVEFVIKSQNSIWSEPDFLLQVDDFQNWLRDLQGVSYVASIVDEIKDMNRVYHGGGKEHDTIPKTKEEVAQYLLLLSAEEDFDSFVQDDSTVGRISLRAKFKEAAHLVKLIPVIEQELQKRLGRDNQAYFTGFVKLMRDMEQYLLRSQIMSLGLAIVIITIMMGFLFCSIKLALFALIPNVLPILLGLSFMAVVGIDLDPGTIMIGSIAIGLIVDDTMHFMVRFRRHLDYGSNIKQSIEKTMIETGRPIIMTSFVLAIGFFVMIFGSFSPNIYFGLVSGFVVLMALIADLVLLPAALVVCFFSHNL